MRVLLLLCLIAPSAPLWAQVQIFSDVPASDSRYPTTALMYELGITSGCSVVPSQYCPDWNVTRGSAAVFIIRAIYGDNFTVTQDPNQYFSDVQPSHPQFLYIQKMRDLGITSGTGNNQFRPDDTLPNWRPSSYGRVAFATTDLPRARR